MKSQNDRILAYLQRGYAITPLLALRNFGTLRLSGRIFDLRRDGWRIESRMIRVGKKRVAQYTMAS